MLYVYLTSPNARNFQRSEIIRFKWLKCDFPEQVWAGNGNDFVISFSAHSMISDVWQGELPL